MKKWSPLRRQHFAALPNLVTLLNLFSGFLSLLMASRGKTVLAGWLIILSLIWDSLDGNIARMFKNCSDLGRELDSLADIVSFVVAPAFLMSRFLLHHISPWMLLLLFCYLSAGAYRLARFNLRPPVKDYFEGFPTPAAAVLLTMTLLACIKNGWIDQALFGVASCTLLTGLSLLMVSRVHYPKLSAMPFVRWQSLLYGSLVSFFGVSILMNIETAIVAVMLIFLFISPLYCLSFAYKISPAPVE